MALSIGGSSNPLRSYDFQAMRPPFPLHLDVDPSSGEPMYRQLYEQLRQQILDGVLMAGMPLPSTRDLARQLAISRITAVTAYEQLAAEGYVEAKRGSATRVCDVTPETPFEKTPQRTTHRVSALQLSAAGRRIASTPLGYYTPDSRPQRPFAYGAPELNEGMLRMWSRLQRAVIAGSAGSSILGYGDAAGYEPLREQIARYLRASRGVRCSAGDVVIVSGAQQALDLASRVLIDPGDRVWMEEPGFGGARAAFLAAGANAVNVPVDQDGLRVDLGRRKWPNARGVYVTPAHQYPTGVAMSVQRRLELLDWAAARNAWIIEDDYDSEFRYESRPLGALQGLDEAGRVIYAGSFSKVLFPALRIGYAVVPPAILDAFRKAKIIADRQTNNVEQAVLARFIEEGHFGRHIRRTRETYRWRQEAIIDALLSSPWSRFPVEATAAGMHVVVAFPDFVDDVAVCRALGERKLQAVALSETYAGPHRRSGLILGFAAHIPGQLRYAVSQMTTIHPEQFGFGGER